MFDKKRKLSVGLAVALVTIIFCFGAYLWMTPYAYVSLDGKPSIVYSMNVFGGLIHVEAFNSEGEAVLAACGGDRLFFHSIEEGVWDSLMVMKEKGSFSADSADVILLAASSRSVEHTEKLVARLENLVEVHIGQEALPVEIMTVALSEEEFLAAFNSGLSMGRYQILERVREALIARAAMVVSVIEEPVVQVPREARVVRTTSSVGVQPSVPVSVPDGVTSASPKDDDEKDEDIEDVKHEEEEKDDD